MTYYCPNRRKQALTATYRAACRRGMGEMYAYHCREDDTWILALTWPEVVNLNLDSDRDNLHIVG